MDLAYRLVMFIKNIDPYGYLDSLGSDETDEDVIENYREFLKNPLLIMSAIEVLEEMMKNGTIDESDAKEKDECMELTEELKQLYRDTIEMQNQNAERITR